MYFFNGCEVSLKPNTVPTRRYAIPDAACDFKVKQRLWLNLFLYYDIFPSKKANT